ncbi:hypothetical protein K505DRAFT_346420 [Melanomma pulvis-pyrius CBS 109.77]|uniref:HMG box domain-containing protein n=1 Tax=Melanomma pulvis-pyrius CBS 109.77 TaxID=1314802 RepID=A0A6A6XSD0_9PLEO|nr:hypothetical protein K505DRAFT_346420 [Melanomma pulvis-pyrius CBS 109.77]
MLARGLLCRLAADTPQTKTHTHDLPQLARLLQRSICARNGLTSPALNALARIYRTVLVQNRRSYATAAAVKKPVTRKAAATKPTATVKKAVKKAAAAKKKAPATKRKTAASKKKPAAKRKPVARKKKPVTKARPKRAKKVLTPEEKQKLQLRELKKKALRGPPHVAISAWQAFTSEAIKAAGSGTVQEKLAAAGAKFKDLTPAEREHYNHVATEKNAIRKAAYKDWVESHTPEEIRVANRARATIRRRHKAAGGKTVPAHTVKIHDEREVKAPRLPFLRFSIERRATGDFKNIAIPDASKLIGKEWHALTESEKQPYKDAYLSEKEALA